MSEDVRLSFKIRVTGVKSSVAFWEFVSTPVYCSYYGEEGPLGPICALGKAEWLSSCLGVRLGDLTELIADGFFLVLAL